MPFAHFAFSFVELCVAPAPAFPQRPGPKALHPTSASVRASIAPSAPERGLVSAGSSGGFQGMVGPGGCSSARTVDTCATLSPFQGKLALRAIMPMASHSPSVERSGGIGLLQYNYLFERTIGRRRGVFSQHVGQWPLNRPLACPKDRC